LNNNFNASLNLSSLGEGALTINLGQVDLAGNQSIAVGRNFNKDIIVLECHLQDREKYFIDSNTFLIHTESEPNDSNRVTDESTIYWIIKSFIEYLQKEEERINTHKETIKKIIKNNI
jgi:hypothetical protein